MGKVEGTAPPRQEQHQQGRVPVPPGYARGLPAPWWLKLGTKLALAGIGLHGARARALGIAEPSFTTLERGRLLDAPEVWIRHARAVLGREPRTLLEIGPGRMVVRAPALAGMGFGRIWYVDPADSAPTGPAPYRAAAALALAHGVAVPDLSGAKDRGAVLARCGATLLTGGPEVLSAVPDGTVDLVVSEVVLEHVRREHLAPLLAQLRRVAAPDGLGLHWVDFHDHLGGGLQHLRFSDAFWASPLVGRAGIYVNRLGLSSLVSRFRRAGFVVAVPRAMAWAERPHGPRRPHPDATRPASDDLVCHAMLEVRPS